MSCLDATLVISSVTFFLVWSGLRHADGHVLLVCHKDRSNDLDLFESSEDMLFEPDSFEEVKALAQQRDGMAQQQQMQMQP